jgi:diacylglycerol kinase
MGFIKSLYTAFLGILYVLSYERNARIHLIVAVAVLMLAVILGLSDTEKAAVFFAAVLVFLAEVINTAIEKTLDLVHPQQSEQVRIIKDMAAGAVLVAAAGAVAIGLPIFLPYIMKLVWPQQ